MKIFELIQIFLKFTICALKKFGICSIIWRNFHFKMNQILSNDLFYELNMDNFTAKVVRSQNTSNHLIIPYSISHQNHEFIVTIIGKKSFYNNKVIESIEFPPNSKIEIIEESAFDHSQLHVIKIPDSVKTIKFRAFLFCKNLKSVEFSENS